MLILYAQPHPFCVNLMNYHRIKWISPNMKLILKTDLKLIHLLIQQKYWWASGDFSDGWVAHMSYTFWSLVTKSAFCLQFWLFKCCCWILTTALDWNLHAVNHWAKMKSTSALKSKLAVVYRLEGVGNSCTTRVLLMGFL